MSKLNTSRMISLLAMLGAAGLSIAAEVGMPGPKLEGVDAVELRLSVRGWANSRSVEERLQAIGIQALEKEGIPIASPLGEKSPPSLVATVLFVAGTPCVFSVDLDLVEEARVVDAAGQMTSVIVPVTTWRGPSCFSNSGFDSDECLKTVDGCVEKVIGRFAVDLRKAVER